MPSAVFLLLVAARALADESIDIFVDPHSGRDGAAGDSVGAPLRSLSAARDAVRGALARSGAVGVRVNLLAGRHRVGPRPLVLGRLDGGVGRQRVVWRSLDARSPAVLDGGVPVKGWAPHPRLPGVLAAPLPRRLRKGATLRQMWVNGARAARPVAYPVNMAECCPGPGRCSCSVKKVDEGYDFAGSAVDPSAWANPSDVEFVFHFPGSWTPWIEPRCTVAGVRGSVASVKEPCWGDLLQRNVKPANASTRPMPPPAFVENVLSNLTLPGQWYYDRAEASILYIPREGEDASVVEASAFVSTTEAILVLNETSNIAWEDVEFQHATWLVPSSSSGYVDWQAGHSGGYGTGPDYEDCHNPASCKKFADSHGCGNTTLAPPWCGFYRGVEPLGNVQVLQGHNIVFAGCRFTHLGGIYALSATRASQNVTIAGCVFDDVSGGAVHLGSSGSRWTTGPSPRTPKSEWDSGFVVSDNWIHDVPVEFRGAVGIFAGYVANSSIQHNTLERLTYTGISLGWGWGQNTFMGSNLVANNRIDSVLPHLADGGAMYFQSNQHGTVVSGNYLSHDGNRFGVIYTDGASGLGGISYNVMESNAPDAPSVFLHGGGQMPVDHVWYRNSSGVRNGCGDSCPVQAVYEVPLGSPWPEEASRVVRAAGRRDGRTVRALLGLPPLEGGLVMI